MHKISSNKHDQPASQPASGLARQPASRPAGRPASRPASQSSWLAAGWLAHRPWLAGRPCQLACWQSKAFHNLLCNSLYTTNNEKILARWSTEASHNLPCNIECCVANEPSEHNELAFYKTATLCPMLRRHRCCPGQKSSKRSRLVQERN